MPVIPTGVFGAEESDDDDEGRRTRTFAISQISPVFRYYHNMKTYYVYILANPGRSLYVGMTNDLVRRVYQHRNGAQSGFTAKYGIHQLVFYEELPTARDAIDREKQIKNWRREKKLALIREMNPEWRDLSDGWFE